MAAWYELSTPAVLRLTSFLFWSNLYLFVIETFPDKSPEWCTRVVTLLHGTVAVLVGWHHSQVTHSGHCLASYISNNILPSQHALMLWSWGYFAFDLLWCAIYWTDAILMLCHHLAALSAITIFMQQENPNCMFARALILTEVTNPLLQIRWFLKKEGYGNTLAFLFIEVIYLMMFLFLRGIVGTYFLYWTLTTDYFCLKLKFLCVCLYVVSISLIYDAGGYIKHKYNIQELANRTFCNLRLFQLVSKLKPNN